MAAKRLLLAPLALAALAGCPSLSTLQTPSTVPQGDVRLGFAAQQVGITTGEEAISVPQVEFTVRYGLTDDLDFGIKLYLVGAEAGMKYQFLRGPLDISLAPAASYFSFTTTASDIDGNAATTSVSLTGLHAPLLIGYNVSDKLTIGFGPKFLYIIASGSVDSGAQRDSATEGGALLGGFLNVPIRVGKAFWIAPEVNIYKPLGANTGGIVWQGGLGFLFGGAPRATATAMAP